MRQGNAMVLAMELCCIDLQKLLEKAVRPLSDQVIKPILRQILEGVAACHAAGVHRYPVSRC